MYWLISDFPIMVLLISSFAMSHKELAGQDKVFSKCFFLVLSNELWDMLSSWLASATKCGNKTLL
jgi:hypothetical protein